MADEIHLSKDKLETVLKFIKEKCTEMRLKGNTKESMEYFDIFFSILGIKKLDDIRLDNKNFEQDNIKSEEFIKLYLGMLTEFSIIAYYTNKQHFGCVVSDRLLLTEKETGKWMISNNQRFYLNKIERINRIPIVAKAAKLYYPLNASIIKTDDGYLVNARTVNYVLHDDGSYQIKDGTTKVNTKNYIMIMNKDLDVLGQHELIDTAPCDSYESRVIGLEDVVLFKDSKGDLYCTCTTLDTNPANMAQISLCKISDGVDEENQLKIISKRPIYLIDEHRSEKNWLPYYLVKSDNDDTKGSFRFIYSYSPTIVREIQHSDELFTEIGHVPSQKVIEKEVNFNLGRFRGSAGPLPFKFKNKEGYLIVVHEVTWPNGNSSRNYTHRFVFMTNDFEITHLSLPFYFEELSVEFCRSMCYSHGDSILLTVGIKDKESWLYILDVSYITGLLCPLEYFEL